MEQCKYLAARGMLAMSAEYRIRGLHETKAISCVEDGRSAVAWIRQEAARLGVDPQRIAAGGGSAGAHVAACTGTIPVPGSVPNAMILFNPPMSLAPIEGIPVLDPEKLLTLPERTGVPPKDISPYHHIAAGQPPAIILHGKADAVIPFASIEAYAKATLALGNRCEVVGYDEQGHGFFNFGRAGNAMYSDTVAKVDTFLVSLGWLSAP